MSRFDERMRDAVSVNSQYGHLSLELLEQVGRSCTGCTVCCTILHVREIEKIDGYDCPHQTGTGCGIYSDRPDSCASYACGWLAGLVDGARPSVSGLLVSSDHESAKLGEVIVFEVREGALATEEGWDTVRTIVERTGFAVRISPCCVRRRCLGAFGMRLDPVAIKGTKSARPFIATARDFTRWVEHKLQTYDSLAPHDQEGKPIPLRAFLILCGDASKALTAYHRGGGETYLARATEALTRAGLDAREVIESIGR
jgi:hypothetical protein